MLQDLFYKDSITLVRVAITTIVGFLILFLFVRISGKRTLSKLNAFDFVVTVALGSTLSYMMLGLVPIVEGAIVLFLIILMQYGFAWSARSSKKMERLINSIPTLLYYNGTFIQEAMSKEAVTKEELHAAVRRAGIEYIAFVKAIVMEINGEITVIPQSKGSGNSSLNDVREQMQ